MAGGKERRCCAREGGRREDRRGGEKEEVNRELREKRRRRWKKGPGKLVSWNHANCINMLLIYECRGEDILARGELYPETGIQVQGTHGIRAGKIRRDLIATSPFS